MNSWLRLWHDMPNDPKWKTISRVSKTQISEVISVYIHLLVDGSSNDVKRGVTQCNAEDIASALDVDTDVVSRIIEAMQGRVLDGNLLTGWEHRQPKREDNSAERVRAYRVKRNVTQCNAPDKDKDKDKDNNIITADDSESNQTTKVKKDDNLGKRLKEYLGESFIPTEWANWCSSELGWSQSRIDDTFAVFYDHWTVGKGKSTRGTNWGARWRNWCSKDSARGSSKTSGGVRDNALAAISEVASRRYGGI